MKQISSSICVNFYLKKTALLVIYAMTVNTMAHTTISADGSLHSGLHPRNEAVLSPPLAWLWSEDYTLAANWMQVVVGMSLLKAVGMVQVSPEVDGYCSV